MGALAETIIGIKGKTFAVNDCNVRSATTFKNHGPPPVSVHRAPFGASLRKFPMQRPNLVPIDRGLLLKLIKKQGRTCRRESKRCLLKCGGGGAMLPTFGAHQHAERMTCWRTWSSIQRIELRGGQVKCRRHHLKAGPCSIISRSASHSRSSISGEGQYATSVFREESNTARPQQGSETRRGAQLAERTAKVHWQKALALVLGAVCCSSPCNAQGLPATTPPYVATTTSIAGQSRPPFQFVSRIERPSKVTASVRAYDPVDTRDRAAAAAFESRASNAVNLLNDARQASGAGRWSEALQTYSKIVADYSDLALAAYARVGRALALYEVGDKVEAILELQDMSLELKGSPEVHAALAAMLYHDKKQFAQAENQFAAATILDPRYNDVDWVKEQKVWPPSLLQALTSFLLLN